jgi:hypothetical protein
MHGFVIEHDPCPRCSNLRTVRFSSNSYCFNCRLLWSGDSFIDGADEPAASYPFTESELVRLRVYRAAVRAGFYTERLRGAGVVQSRGQ